MLPQVAQNHKYPETVIKYTRVYLLFQLNATLGSNEIGTFKWDLFVLHLHRIDYRVTKLIAMANKTIIVANNG